MYNLNNTIKHWNDCFTTDMNFKHFQLLLNVESDRFFLALSSWVSFVADVIVVITVVTVIVVVGFF